MVLADLILAASYALAQTTSFPEKTMEKNGKLMLEPAKTVPLHLSFQPVHIFKALLFAQIPPFFTKTRHFLPIFRRPGEFSIDLQPPSS
jgi:hypothetical protein